MERIRIDAAGSCQAKTGPAETSPLDAAWRASLPLTSSEDIYVVQVMQVAQRRAPKKMSEGVKFLSNALIFLAPAGRCCRTLPPGVSALTPAASGDALDLGGEAGIEAVQERDADVDLGGLAVGSREAILSPNVLRHRILASIRLRAVRHAPPWGHATPSPCPDQQRPALLQGVIVGLPVRRSVAGWCGPAPVPPLTTWILKLVPTLALKQGPRHVALYKRAADRRFDGLW